MLAAAALPLLFLLQACDGSGNENVVRIEERLSSDREFYENWMHLVGLQAQELEEQSVDFPVVPAEIYANLSSCKTPKAAFMDTINYIRPSDVAIYAEIGHLTRHCAHNFSDLQAGILDSCAHRSSDTPLPTLDKLFRLHHPNLSYIDSNRRDEPLRDQAKSIAESIKEIPDYERKWKLIIVIPSVQDGEASETGQTAVEVLAMIEELEKQLPVRTFVLVIESSGKGIWADASHSHAACRQILARWKGHSHYNTESVWEQVIKIAANNFRKPNFTVEFLPLLKNASLVQLPDAMDLSALGYDCAHFSERGISLLHTGIWNEIWTKASQRSTAWRPEPGMILCPDPTCPFVRTQRNSGICEWNRVETWISLLPGEFIAVAILVLALLLTICLLVCLCAHRTPARLQKRPLHSFGSTFSSIRFIDDDA